MTIFWDGLHIVGILFPMKHLLGITSSHLWALGPISLVAPPNKINSSDVVVFSNATTFLYFSLLKGYTMEVSPYVAGGCTCRFDVNGMLLLPLLGIHQA